MSKLIYFFYGNNRKNYKNNTEMRENGKKRYFKK